jgi:transposase
MNTNLETAQKLIQEFLKGTQELTEEKIRVWLREDPELVIFFVLEQHRRLKEKLAAKQIRKITAPSGSIPLHEKENTKRRKTKRGRKRGHAGACRKKPAEITQRVTHEPLQICPDCGGPLNSCASKKAKRTRIIEDIPEAVEAVVTEHEIPRSYCPKCKKLVEPKVEDALPNATLGNRVLALSGHWHYGLGMPSQTIADILDSYLSTTISLGGLFGMWNHLASCLEPWREQLMNELHKSTVLHADESGWRVNGQRHWIWCFSNRDTTFYMIHTNRNLDALFEFFQTHFDGVLVSDFYPCYEHVNSSHQYCLAHLLRELKKVDGLNPSAEWQEFSKKTKRLFADALRLYHREGYDPNDFSSRIERLNRRLIDLMLMSSTDPDVRRLTKRLEKFWDELLVFLEQPEVPPTNNQAEREIRPAVIMRKVLQGNQSEKGARTQAILMTIYRTLKRRALNPVTTIVDALKTLIRTGHLPPFPSSSVSED